MDLKKKLTPEQFRITQQSGTEAPFTGQYVNHYESGDYVCVCCNNLLFSSTAKFDSASGWPSFYDIATADSVISIKDDSHNMARIEIKCKNCNSHLGHVFPDGPAPSNKRYCINSAALNFKKI